MSKSGSAIDNTASLQIAQNNPPIAQKLHRLRKPPAKTHAAYWLDKVIKPAGCSSYAIQLYRKGQRHRFALATPDKSLAAERARDRYVSLVTTGWEGTLAKFKPEARPKSATVGALIEAATRLSSARQESLVTYCHAFRRIASAAAGLDSARSISPSKLASWRARVDALSLDKITPAAVLAFKIRFLKAAKGPEARNSAAVSFNALLRNSKALLSKKVRPFIEKEIALPSPLWFEGIAREKEPSLRYHSKIDAGQILAAAHAELANAKPEVFKALLLTLACGLRRSEADALLWSQFDFDAGTLAVADTEHKALKSADSAGVIGLDAELVTMLRGFHVRAKSEFVIEAAPSRKDAPSRTYRANVHFEALKKWLRAKGVPGIRPIHTMRKEIGSIIASRDGIFAASRFLRHSDIGITSRLYADTKKPVSAGLGALLAAPPVNVIEFQPQEAKPVKASKGRRTA